MNDLLSLVAETVKDRGYEAEPEALRVLLMVVVLKSEFRCRFWINDEWLCCDVASGIVIQSFESVSLGVPGADLEGFIVKCLERFEGAIRDDGVIEDGSLWMK